MQRKRVAVYVRTETDEEESGRRAMFARRQQRACSKLIKARRAVGWEWIKSKEFLYSDRNCGGMSLNRPALKQLLQDVDAGKVSAVVVASPDKLTNRIEDFVSLSRAFALKGARLCIACDAREPVWHRWLRGALAELIKELECRNKKSQPKHRA